MPVANCHLAIRGRPVTAAANLATLILQQALASGAGTPNDFGSLRSADVDHAVRR
jgi:hypothetical protein